MSYELGRAELIIDIGAEQYFADLARVFNETTRDADEITKDLAKQLKIRERDVKAAAAITIAENKKAAQETLKADREAAAQRKAQTQELLRFHQREYQEEVAAKKAAEREKLKAEKEAAAEAKKIAAERRKAAIDQIKNEVSELKKAERAQKEADKAVADRIRTLQRLDKERDNAAKKELNRIQREIDAQKRAEAQEQRRTQSRTRSGSGTVLGINPGGLGGDVATLLGFGAIASGALVLRESIISLIEATTKQEQAQRSLNAAFGASAILFKEQADAYAAQFGQVNSTIEQAVTKFGVLNAQTNLTGAQIRRLTSGAVELQAAFGGDLQEAFRSTAGAILGETEAFEKYGLVLQEQVLKSSDRLTESERRRFSTMSESEKQMIRYRLIMEKVAEVQGTAAKRAEETQGGFDRLARGGDELAKVLGSKVVPELGKAAGGFGALLEELAKATKEAQNFTSAEEELTNQMIENARRRHEGNLAFSFIPDEFIALAEDVNQRLQTGKTFAERAKEEKDRQDAIRASAEAGKRRIAEIREANKDAEKLETDRRARADAQAKADRERILDTLEYAKEQRIKGIQEEKRLAEIEKKNKLEAINEAQQAELRRLDDIEDARREASRKELERINNEKDAALDAIDARRDAELERLDREKEASEKAAEANIRQLEIERDRLFKEADQRKDAELDRLETEKEARDRLRKKEDAEIEDSIKHRERLLEDAHTKELRRIERQGEALREAYEDEIAKIEEKEDKEEERHRKALTRTNKERNAAIDAIDAQIDALEAAERRRDEARRRRELNNQLSDAQVRLRQATGTGDAVAAGQARDKLVSAIRIGDPTAIKKAQDELAEIVGQGIEAVAEAQRDLGDLQADIRDNDVKETEQAEKEKLEAQKKALQKQEDNEKEQEENRNRRRKSALDQDKKAAKEKLDDALKKLERQQEAENDKFKNDKRELDDSVKTAKRALDEVRDAEDQSYEESVEAVQKRHKTEREEIETTYNDEETGYIPAIKRALEATQENYEEQVKAVQKRHKAERDEVEATTKIAVQQHQDNENAQRKAYENMVRETRDRYEEMRKTVEKTYRADDGKSGILDQLDEQERYTNEKLADIKRAFENAAKGLVGEEGVIKKQWEDAVNEAEKYFKYVEEELRKQRTAPRAPRPDGIQVGPDPGLPGSTTSGGGIGTAPDRPGSSATTGPPENREQTSVAIPPDDITGMYSVAVGYGQKYSGGTYPQTPGWEGNAVWAGGPSHHKGVDLVIPGAARNGYGSAIPAFYPGRVKRTASDSNGPGGKMVIIEDSAGRTHWYLHLKDYTVEAGEYVHRGDIIAHMGDTGSEEFPHLHYEVRNGDNNGPSSLEQLRREGIDPLPFVHGQHDTGYKFMNPTLTYDMRTGARGVLAERGPERLLGRRDTQTFDSMGLTAKLRRPNPFMPDYDQMGNAAIGAQTVAQVVNNRGGDSLTYYGVAPDDMLRKWRADQRRRNGLRGIR